MTATWNDVRDTYTDNTDESDGKRSTRIASQRIVV